MPRITTIAFSAFVLLIALSALPAQQETNPQRAAGRPNAPRKQVHPNVDPQTARSAAQSDNRRRQSRRNQTPAARPAQRAHGNAPVRVKERSPENPVRFAFAPHDRQTAASRPMPWDQTPSAGAIMSTFLTGELSPEVIQWHVNQRKKTLYEKNHPDELARSAPRRAADERGGYGEMLHRMEFAWGNRSPRFGEPAEMYGYDDEYGGEYVGADPSNGSVLVQLLTGYKNGEIREWKENQTFMARRGAPRELPAAAGRPLPMYASARPIPQGAPLPAAEPRDGNVYASSRVASGNVRQSELSTMPSGDGQVRLATAEEPRFVDDGFPAAGAAPRRNPIRQVSAEFRAPVPGNVVGRGENVRRSGQIRVYSEDEDGWSPVE
ncbi:MAG: hypothetical protein IKE69_02105 [Thermoguttaceae bacterium]|nr:hypothetical protein [Thermoguttaceae bacterium]